MGKTAWLAAVLFLAAGCQSTSKPESDMDAPAPMSEFAPAHYKVDAQYADGTYSDLYTADSYALWVSSTVAAAKFEEAVEQGTTPDDRFARDAVQITNSFVLIEAHLVSAFGDMSIAYDVVGLRNVNVYLETPGGTKIAPIQKVFNGSLEETQEGALKRFARDIVLIFPKRDLWLQQPTLSKEMPSVKLVFESPHGTFQFDWPAGPPDTPPAPLTMEERLAAARIKFDEFYGRLRGLARNFS